MRPIRLILFAVWTVFVGVTGAQTPTPTPSMTPSGIVLNVDALYNLPSMFQNLPVALTDIKRISQTEVGEGKYQLSLYGNNDTVVVNAILPFKWATLAVRSKTLYVAVKDAKATPPTLTIYGNATAAEGSAGKQKIIWAEPQP